MNRRSSEVGGPGGGSLLLALERAHTDATGTAVRLWLLNATGSADVQASLGIHLGFEACAGVSGNQ